MIGSSQWLSVDSASLENHKDIVLSHLRARGAGADVEQDVQKIIQLKLKKSELVCSANEHRHQRKVKSNEIGDLIKSKQLETADGLKKEVEVLKQAIADLDSQISNVDGEIEQSLLTLPNLLDDRCIASCHLLIIFSYHPHRISPA